MIVDSSAILAIFFRESGAEDVLSTILEADLAGIGSPTAAEAGLVLTGRTKHNATGSLLRFFQETGIEIVPFTDPLATRHRRVHTIRQGSSSRRAELRRLHDLCDGGSGAPSLFSAAETTSENPTWNSCSP